MTAFVTLTDQSYYHKALQTIEELRTNGEWKGDIVLVAVDFEPSKINNIIVHKVNHIDHQPLWDEWKIHPIKKMDDNRHYNKVYQWDKLYLFTEFFNQWERIVFLDAGLRVCDNVNALLSLDYKGKILAPDDSDPYDNGKRLNTQFDLEANKMATNLLNYDYENWMTEKYFINCMFLFDTQLIELKTFDYMKMMMYKYPISLCNEMGIMNLYFTIYKKVWVAFPQKINDKYLFGWCELNYKENPKWQDFHFIKYSVTMK